LRGAHTIGGEGTIGGVAARVGLRCVDAGHGLSEEGKISPVQGKVVHAPTVDHLADRGILGLQRRRSSRDFHGLGDNARRERDVQDDMLVNTDRDVRFDSFGKPRGLGAYP